MMISPRMRPPALIAAAFAAAVAALACAPRGASAQECVTCRSARCSGMFWIDPCEAKKPKKKKVQVLIERHAGAGECKDKLGVEVDFPARVREGDFLGIRIRASCRAWLVVYDVERPGAGAVIWPSKEEPAPEASPAAPALLPSVREAAAGVHMEALLVSPGVPSRGTFLVFAFADRADWDRVKPALGATSTDGAALAAELERKLAALAPARWARAAADYVIEPQKK